MLLILFKRFHVARVKLYRYVHMVDHFEIHSIYFCPIWNWNLQDIRLVKQCSRTASETVIYDYLLMAEENWWTKLNIREKKYTKWR